MFSRRTPGSLAPNALTRARAALPPPRFDATISNPTLAGIFEEDSCAWLEDLNDAQTATYEPQPRGLAATREAVSDYYAGHCVDVQAEHIFLTSSSSESYSWLFKLMCEPGDEVLVPHPSYPLFDCLADLDALRAVPYTLLREQHWAIDFDALARSATPRTRAVIVVHPHNPTGSYLRIEEAGRLVRFCADRSLALISDEVFYDYAFAPDPRRARPLVEHSESPVFSLGGMSKYAGLPQMKLGWIAINSPGSVLNETLERLEWIADSYLPVSAPVQYAAARWLHGVAPARRAAILRRTAASLSCLSANLPPEVRLLRPEGGWSAILEVPRLRSEDDWVLALLEQQGVLVQPGYFYDLDREGFLVVSLLSPAAVLEAVVTGLRTLV